MVQACQQNCALPAPTTACPAPAVRFQCRPATFRSRLVCPAEERRLTCPLPTRLLPLYSVYLPLEAGPLHCPAQNSPGPPGPPASCSNISAGAGQDCLGRSVCTVRHRCPAPATYLQTVYTCVQPELLRHLPPAEYPAERKEGKPVETPGLPAEQPVSPTTEKTEAASSRPDHQEGGRTSTVRREWTILSRETGLGGAGAEPGPRGQQLQDSTHNTAAAGIIAGHFQLIGAFNIHFMQSSYW